ncbi:MAG: 4Fe-4S binding protein [Desulfobacterales bacterium]
MNDDVYVKLCERLNKNAVKRPPLPSVLTFLKEIFTEEQADLASQMPLGAHTANELAEQLNRDETELKNILETMADEGIMFSAQTEGGRTEYSLPPFAPGILELQYLKGEETEKARKRHRLITEMNKELSTLTEKLFNDVEAANKRIGSPGLRTLAVEEHLPSNAQIATWEKISEIMADETSFAVGTCTCRQDAKFEGNPCKVDGAPMEACVYFGKVADYIVSRNFGKRYTRQELMDLLKTCEEKGLIHNINNFMGDNIVLCNCCGCCCHIMKPMLKHRGLNMIAGSNFVSVVDEETCIGCGECVDICQVDAIEMIDDIARINPDYCMGCANCVSLCPSGSLTLVRCADYKPPKQSEKVVGFGI